jgi:hypothetical protein
VIILQISRSERRRQDFRRSGRLRLFPETILRRALNSLFAIGHCRRSPSGPLDLVTQLLQLGNDAFPLVALNLDSPVLDATISTVARRIYTEHTFDDLPILATAIRDAGCTDPDILAHCREAVPTTTRQSRP